MIVGMTTIDRREVEPIVGTENYLEQTLESLLRPYISGVDIVLFDSGSNQTDFIDSCVQRWSFIDVDIAPSHLTLMKNTNRALYEMLQMSDDEWIILIQDDLIFVENVLTILPELLSRAPLDAGMLSFVSQYTGCNADINGYVAYPSNEFYGLYFTAFKRNLLEQWFASPEHRNAMYFSTRADLFIGKWFEAVSRVYAYNPNLGRHIGAVSANHHTTLFDRNNGKFLNAPFNGEDYGIVTSME